MSTTKKTAKKATAKKVKMNYGDFLQACGYASDDYNRPTAYKAILGSTQARNFVIKKWPSLFNYMQICTAKVTPGKARTELINACAKLERDHLNKEHYDRQYKLNATFKRNDLTEEIKKRWPKFFDTYGKDLENVKSTEELDAFLRQYRNEIRKAE